SWWSRNRQLILRLAGTVLAIALLVLLIKEEGWNEILAAMREIKTLDLLWVALLFSLSRLAIVLRWHVLLLSGGVKIRFRNSLALTFMGLFAGNFLPTTIGGDVVRLAGAMQMGFDRAVSLASIAADRLIGMLGMSMTVPIGMVYSWNILQLSPAALSWISLFQKPAAFARRMMSIFSIWFRKPVSILAALAFTWIHMLCLFGSIYVFVDDLGSHVSFWMIAGLWSLTYFITLIPISINGYGLQELSFTFLMSNVAGLTPALSLTVAVLIRAYFLLSSLPGALFLPSILSAIARQKSVVSSPEPLR
ncbi:MAG TPA: lysylphosphatidylglycerol synthase transmembrane domain-containing protein, partial [Anaerolineales bacterium]|nr:lysylphosphatidylglycerol synthase transmembrane domain-containing protein [Anaerolineales bacterium]